MNKDLSPDLNNGITRAIFISWGTTPELRDKLIIYVNGAQIKLKDSLTTFIEILSYPGAVPDRKLLQISVTSCSDADMAAVSVKRSIYHQGISWSHMLMVKPGLTTRKPR